MNHQLSGDIIYLNVGGTRFATSRQTLTWVPDSFFTSMLSGRISSLRDETGAIFIDRDPKLFSYILNFMRTKDIDLRHDKISEPKDRAWCKCETSCRVHLCGLTENETALWLAASPDGIDSSREVLL